MKSSLKGFLAVLLFFSAWQGTAHAGQEFHLSYSPNERYRVVVEQVLDRRVGDHQFFRYPLSVVNIHNPKHHFEIKDGGSPLIKETDKGTFTVHKPSIRFDWAPDSLKFFMYVEVIEGTWKTYFVDINTGIATDVTSDLEKNLVSKADGREWDCQQPVEAASVVKWTKPNLAFLKLTSVCGKDRTKANEKFFTLTDSILFDALKAKVVDHCMDCKDEKSLKMFDKYFISTIPTATPTPEETPTNQ
jgi:hypothetical protein